VEPVAWISARRDLLMMFFGLATLLAYVQRVRRPSVGRYLLVCLLFLCGLMSKSVLVTLPMLLLLLDYWPMGRYGSASLDGTMMPWRRRLGPLIIEKMPLFALSVAVGLVNYKTHRSDMPLEPILSAGAKLSHALNSYLWYMSKTIFPTKLAVFYPYRFETPSLLKTGAAFSLIVVVFILAYILRRRAPYLLVGWSWFVITLFPVIGLVQVGGQATADRYTYYAHIGILLLATWGAIDIARHSRMMRRLVPSAGGAALFAFWIACFLQVQFWRDDTTLFEHALAVTTGNWVAQNNLGMVHLNSGELDRAAGLFQDAIHNTVLFPEAHYNLGLALFGQGRYQDAIPAFREALREKPSLSSARLDLAQALDKTGVKNEALTEYLEVYRRDPANLQTRVLLGAHMAKRGGTEAARLLFDNGTSGSAVQIQRVVDLVIEELRKDTR
jgi:hypothetical protein